MTNNRSFTRAARLGRVSLLSLGLAMAAVAPSAPVWAQNAGGNLFAPRVWVNDKAITEYEVAQRAQFLRLLNAPVDPEAEALKALIDDRLRVQEARRVGITMKPEQITAGMEEFAARANLTSEQFVQALEQGGVAAQTFRDFVEAGSVWREVVRARYASQVQVSDAEIDKVLNAASGEKPLRILLSELVIPLPPGGGEEEKALAERLSDEVKGEGGFASAASRYSQSPTRGRGGRLDWMPLANLPPQIASQVLALDVGQVSDPVYVPGAVVLFYLRDIAGDPNPAQKPPGMKVEYAEYLIADTAEEIARVRARVDTCMDLYADAKGKPAELLTVSTRTMAEIPRDVGLELARLDPGESSVALTRGGARLFLMLCNRSPISEEAPNREAIRQNITNKKLEGLSDGYLEELRHAAMIRQP